MKTWFELWEEDVRNHIRWKKCVVPEVNDAWGAFNFYLRYHYMPEGMKRYFSKSPFFYNLAIRYSRFFI